jgi:uncharacterized protein
VHVEEPVPGLRTELADVPEGTPIAADLTLESVVEGIFVRGSLEGRFTMRCARCLKTFERDFDVEMTELVAREPGPDDDYALEPDLTLDPEPIVRDAVVLEMPFSPLCRPDCLGLCEICGGDRNLGECPGHEVTDPRWDALDVLLQHLEAPPREGPSPDSDARATRAEPSARPVGRRSPPPTPSAHSATSRSCLIGSAGTAGTTRVVKRSRSSSA